MKPGFSPSGLSGHVATNSYLQNPSAGAHGFLTGSKDIKDKKICLEGSLGEYKEVQQQSHSPSALQTPQP